MGEVSKETTIIMEGTPLTERCIWPCGSMGIELTNSKWQITTREVVLWAWELFFIMFIILCKAQGWDVHALGMFFFCPDHFLPPPLRALRVNWSENEKVLWDKYLCLPPPLNIHMWKPYPACQWEASSSFSLWEVVRIRWDEVRRVELLWMGLVPSQ